MMRRVVVALLLVAAVIGAAGFATGDTDFGFGSLAVVGVAWLLRDFARAQAAGTP